MYLQPGCDATVAEGGESRQLGGGDGDEEFAGLGPRDATVGAVLFGGCGAGAAQFGFEAAGRVVDACVDDAGVVGALVAGDAGFFLYDDDICAGASVQQLPSHR